MFWAFLGILFGLVIGGVTDLSVPTEFTRYTAVVIVGMLDAMFGALRAEITRDQYNVMIFITGLLFNILLAVGITYLGDRLGVDLYLAATVVFTFRIFQNMGIIRRALLENWLERRMNRLKTKEIAKITWRS